MPDSTDLINFNVIIPDKVFRGGQPSRDGFSYLKSLGVKTLVQLNYPEEGMQDVPDFKCVDVSMPPKDFWQFFGKPDLVDAVAALDALTDEANWPVYVHCLHGEDRTGMIAAMFRVRKQDWSPDDARVEWQRLAGHPPLPDLLATWHEFLALT